MNTASIAPGRLPALVAGMPKAELHMHVEGSLEPELMFELARRNGVSLAYPDVASLRAAYAFSDLQSFLDIYYAGASVLRTEQDFDDMAWAYLQRAAADGVLRTEMFFDPQTHTERGVAFETVLNGLERACDRARGTLGVDAALILCFLRHLSEAAAFETLEAAWPHRGRFIGIGLDSSERGHPPEKFARVFAHARQAGLHLVAHAGEEGPPAYIRSALDVLQVERIDHGVRCMEDAALVAELVRRQVPLTVCPLSNVKLKVFDTMAAHNLARMLAEGLCVTVNSDDPAYFGGYLNRNYEACCQALSLDAAAAYRLARNSFEAAFVEPAVRRGYIDRLDGWFADFR